MMPTRMPTSDVYLGVVYISPKNSSYTANSVESPTIEILEKEITEYQKVGRVLLMGDFNARTGTKPDYICNDDDVFAPTPIVLASHLCFARAIELITHPKITLILSFSWGFSSKVAFCTL